MAKHRQSIKINEEGWRTADARNNHLFEDYNKLLAKKEMLEDRLKAIKELL